MLFNRHVLRETFVRARTRIRIGDLQGGIRLSGGGVPLGGLAVPTDHEIDGGRGIQVHFDRGPRRVLCLRRAFAKCRFELLALGLCLLALASTRAADVKHVVLVSVDGLAATYLDDPKADLPTLRKLRKLGASADGMITSFPSVTWPSHTSLVTGTRPRTHGVLANTVFDRRSRQPVIYIGDPVLTKEQTVRVPTLYDAVHAAGLKTAAVIWPATNGASTLDWMIPDAARSELHQRYTTPGLVAELGAAGVDISQLGTWGWQKQYALRRDRLYAQASAYLIEKKQVNLLLVHLVSADGIQHVFGPQTLPAYQAVAFEDHCVKEIWEAIKKSPLAAESALFVVSDHGFAGYDKLIRPNVILKRLGLITTDKSGTVTRRDAWSVATGGSAFVYLFDKQAQARAAEIRAELKKLDAVESVLAPAEFEKLGLPRPEENPEMAQLVVTTRPGFAFDDATVGEPIASAGGHKGCHGHRPESRFMQATFVAWGAGIRAGARIQTIENIDVAPTIARLLHVPLPAAEGRVVGEVLAP
jgi:predicted AlkP superfamily pyrophosphatase or phosphodiesterase